MNFENYSTIKDTVNYIFIFISLPRNPLLLSQLGNPLFPMSSCSTHGHLIVSIMANNDSP